MTKPFAVLQPGDSLESGPFFDPVKGIMWINVRRADGTLTEEIHCAWDGKPTIVTQTITMLPDCKFGVGTEASVDEDDTATIHVTMNSTTAR